MQLKQLARVVVRFNPWQANGRSAREFLSRCQSPAATASNPDCKVECLVRLQGDPYVIVEYTNQKEERIDTGSKTVVQILAQINAVAEEMTITEMLSKAGVLGKKLESDWGVQNDVGASSKTPHE